MLQTLYQYKTCENTDKIDITEKIKLTDKIDITERELGSQFQLPQCFSRQVGATFMQMAFRCTEVCKGNLEVEHTNV